MSNTKRSIARSTITLVASALIVIFALWLFFNRQFALDTYTNWTYRASDSIATISERTELTDKGKFTFYATQPELLGRDSFNNSCPRQEAGSPILGCYTSDDRIYIYDVTDDKLDGMKEVTAAHEVLHAVWFRMSEEEKSILEKQLVAAYEANATDSLKSRMEYYQRTEPTEFVNELHAILGTEVADLGEELEKHYAEYFDRESVLALYDQYNTVYSELSERADELFTLMGELANKIDTASDTYNSQIENFSSDVEDFNERANNGSFTSISQFNSERAELMRRSGQLEVARVAINTNIATYNKYHAEYQEIGKELEVLNNSMDSYHTIDEAPSV